MIMAEKTIEKAAPKAKMPEPARRPFPRPFSFERELERLFDDFQRLGTLWGPERRLFGREAFVPPPAVDMVDAENEIVVKAELPGMTKEDVHVELTDSTLVIKGEKKREKEVKEENYYCSEREYGSIYRSIDLPAEVATEGVKASCKDGVLEIHLPKTEKAKHKAIKVAVQ
jgi:HSP20 family protein